MNRIWIVLLGCVALVSARPAFAGDDRAFLDAPYTDIVHPIVGGPWAVDGISRFQKAIVNKSDTHALIRMQTPIKSQGSRGTCSIFSATAMLESMMVINGYANVQQADYSEEWLEYVLMRNRQSDGSNSTANFNALVRYGTVEESMLPYIADEWTSAGDSTQSKARCGHIPSIAPIMKSCLLGHRDPRLLELSDSQLLDRKSGAHHDPEFQRARVRATEFRDEYMKHTTSGWYVGSTNEVKALLAAGIPVTIGLDFYYGAWNHAKSDSLGIGRDLNNWDQGIVGYPEPGSMDRTQSKKARAGHSVLLVGYDDKAVVTTEVAMADGTRAKFTYQGVYYFKNSWGTSGFGRAFKIDGRSYPGYGMITQRYAHEFGGFYRFRLGPAGGGR